MGQIQWTVALVLIGLFAFAIIGFTISFANTNSAAVDINDDPDISDLNSITQGNLSQFRSETDDTYTSIINSTIASGDETTISGGQFKITPVSALGTAKNIMLVGYKRIFGTDSGFGVFITTFFSLLLFITGLLIWKTWAGKIPD